MNWYSKLADYFPPNEMKNKAQLTELLTENANYKKLETEEYIVMLGEFATFIFVDYLLVNQNKRNKGIGSKVINLLKESHKMIVLEVEQPEESNEDTIKRIQFYEKNGFKKADRIVYTRTDDDGKEFEMDIYYWAPDEVSEHEVFGNMATVCRKIHNFKAERYYDRIIANPDEVLSWE